MQIFWGLLIAGVGVVLVLKSEWLVSNFGRIGWAEQHLGMEGGSRLFYKLLGILAIIVGFMVTTGLIEGLLVSVFGRMFGGFAS